MDFALREEEPPALTSESTAVQRASREKWEHSNRVCLMVMKYTMEKSIRQSIPENNKAKDFLSSVGEKFKTFDKAQKGQYLSLLEKTKYDGVSGVREHMMKLVHYYNKLKSLKVELGDSYLIWQVMESFPSQFDVLKTSYNTQKEEWTIDEMIAIISQEEASIKKVKSHSVQFVASTSGTKPVKKGFKGKSRFEKGNTRKAQMYLEPKKKHFKGNCAYCKKFGHKLVDCYLLKKKNVEREA
ncbi:gag-polypeptide of LTR copia-type [Sesbania bispinosa]|nr:gag-polypeptide of LTR copia-type [Sesbania bispinosa]